MLPKEDRRARGALDPSFMGSEHLRKRQATELQIELIDIDSMTSDVTSVYTNAGKNHIYYRVVD